MKKYLLPAVALIIILLSSCMKKEKEVSAPVMSDDRPIVKVSKTTILADNFDYATISITDRNNNDIAAQCQVIVDGQANGNNLQFYTPFIAAHTIKAKLGLLESLPVTVTATDPGPAKFSQKALAEDFTGGWCGYCPRIADLLNRVQATNVNVLSVAVHNADAAAISAETTLRNYWSINVFPTALINRKYQWNESLAGLDAETHKWAPAGLAIESAITGSTISGKVKLSFDVTTREPLVVCIMLLEDGLVFPQANFYNDLPGTPFFNQGNPITNYVHNHTLRKLATDVFGDPVPVAVQVKGMVYEKIFSFDASAFNTSKCSIVAFAGFANGQPFRSGILNVQTVKAGMNKAFD